VKCYFYFALNTITLVLICNSAWHLKDMQSMLSQIDLVKTDPPKVYECINSGLFIKEPSNPRGEVVKGKYILIIRDV
jgi:hypothetical protein